MAKQESIAVKEPNGALIASTISLYDDTGFTGDMEDVETPRIQIAQTTSEVTTSEKVPLGNFYLSTTKEILGGRDKPLTVIPLSMSKSWILSEEVQGRYRYKKFEPYRPGDSQRYQNWDFEVDGVKWKRIRSLDFFVLLPQHIMRDIELKQHILKTGRSTNVNDGLLACTLSFRSTSYNAGKALVTNFAQAARISQKPFVSEFNLFSEKKVNESGPFFVIRAEYKGKSDEKLHPSCDEWWQLIRSKPNHIVLDDDEATATNVETAATDIENLF